MKLASEGGPRALGPRTRLPRNVRVLSWVSFLQDAASEMLYPVVPLFLTSVLGAPPSVVGLIEGIAEATAAASKAISGRLADRFARKPLIALGYGVSAVAKPVIGLATGWPLVLGARFVDRVGKGVRTSPRDALLAAEVAPAHRGRAFGFHRAADTAGAVVGPLVGLGLYELLNQRLRPLFLVAAIPALASVALIALVREHRPKAAPKAPTEARAADLPLGYRRLVVFLAVFGLANFTDALLILRAQALGLGFVSIILVYALYNAVYAALSYPAGVLSDHIPRRFVFATGLAAFAVAYLGLGLADSSGWVWGLFAIYGAYTALTDGVGKAWVADQLPDHAMGTGIGLFGVITGGCALVAGVWAGLAWSGDGRLPLLISGTLAAVLAVYLATFGRHLDAARP